MKFSVWPNMGHPVDEALDTARWADAAGWYGVWYADHYMPNTGTEEIKPGDTHECWAMLPAIAAATEHVRVGSLVAPTSIHHPAVLANRARTIDHMSQRADGARPRRRVADQRAPRVRHRARAARPPGAALRRGDPDHPRPHDEDRTTFAGDVYTITDATADPKPIQARLPMLVGTAGPRMLRLVARHADEWNTWGHIETATSEAGGVRRGVRVGGSRSRARCTRRYRRSSSSPRTQR